MWEGWKISSVSVNDFKFLFWFAFSAYEKNVSVSFSDKYLDGLDFKTKVNLADFGANDGKNIFPFLKIMIGRIKMFNE